MTPKERALKALEELEAQAQHAAHSSRNPELGWKAVKLLADIVREQTNEEG